MIWSSNHSSISLLDNFFVFYVQSKAGPVLIAVNPFKDVEIYGKDFVTAYRQKLLDSPHVYAISDTAYKEMMRGGQVHLFSLDYEKN